MSLAVALGFIFAHFNPLIKQNLSNHASVGAVHCGDRLCTSRKGKRGEEGGFRHSVLAVKGLGQHLGRPFLSVVQMGIENAPLAIFCLHL